jgi:hypothetical protein
MGQKFTTLAEPMRPVDPRKSRFTLLRQPVPTPLAVVGQKGFTTLIAGGVVDAIGPTLNVITVDGYFPRAVSRLPVLLIALDPFSQSCHTIGHVDVGDMWAPMEDLEPFLPSLPLASCPTLLIPSVFMSPAVAEAVYARWLATFDDGPGEVDALETAATLLTPSHARSELVTFLNAWEDAHAMPAEDFVELLARLCATCHLPFLPE